MAEVIAKTKIEAAQKIRLQRVTWGLVTYGVAFGISVGCYFTGILSLAPLIHFGVSIVLINFLFIMLVLRGINLRFKDPSMTGAQVVSALLPSIYIMYFITNPQARMALIAIMHSRIVGESKRNTEYSIAC